MMKRKTVVLRVDLYTQIVLTVIAVALVGSLLRPILSPTDVVAQGFVQDVNIATIGGKDPTIAVPIKVQVAKSSTLPVSIMTPSLFPVHIFSAETTVPVEVRASELLPVSIQDPDVVPVGIITRDPIPFSLADPAVLAVNVTESSTLSVNIVDSVRLPIEVASPLPVPVVETNIRSWAPKEGIREGY